MKGGARANSGPPPDPEALRRDRASDAAGWTTLPAGGRKGAAPKWPLSKACRREATLWTREWKRPQAVMWQRNGQEIEVALYVRSLAAAEDLDASVASRTLVRQQQEALGISLPGLARHRWRIASAGEPAAAAAAAAPRQTGKAARARFGVVIGGKSGK